MKVEDSLQAILQQMPRVCKPVCRFVHTLAQAFLSVRGRCNFRNLSRYAPLCEHSISRGFGKRFDFAGFACCFFDLFLPEDTFIAALDTTFVAKSGKDSFGKDKFFSSAAGKAVGGLELSVLALVSVEKKTAFSLCVRQSAAGLEDKLTFYLAQIDRLKDFLLTKTTVLVADGLYAKQAFVNGVLAAGFSLVTRLRSDANLRWLYEGEQKPKGRKRKYDGKLVWSDSGLWDRLDFVETLENGAGLYTAVVWSVCLKRRIRLVVLRCKASTGKESVCVLLSTDCQLAASKVYRFYRLRFQIEFLFRDAKTHLGLEHCQSVQEKKLDFHFNFVFLLLNLLKYQWVETGREVFSVADLKTAYFNRNWLETIFVNLEIDTDLIKKHPNYPLLEEWGTIAA